MVKDLNRNKELGAGIERMALGSCAYEREIYIPIYICLIIIKTDYIRIRHGTAINYKISIRPYVHTYCTFEHLNILIVCI